MIFQKSLDFIITLITWLLISLPIHEFGHDIGATLVGQPAGWVTFNLSSWTGTHFLPAGTMLTSAQSFLWSISGGVFTALIMGILWWRSWASPCRWDMDDEASLAILGLWQISYGISETLNIRGGEYLGLLGFALGFAFYMPKVIKWITSEEGS